MNSIFYRFVKWIPLGRVGEIHPEAVNGLIESDPSAIQLVDVRSQTEWRSGHLRGAVNIPITELASRIGDLDFDKEVLLVPICLSAHRSIPAVRIFEEHGYKDVRQLSGGMRNWNRSFRSKLVT